MSINSKHKFMYCIHREMFSVFLLILSFFKNILFSLTLIQANVSLTTNDKH
jgi:hypothetical protein